MWNKLMGTLNLLTAAYTAVSIQVGWTERVPQATAGLILNGILFLYFYHEAEKEDK